MPGFYSQEKIAIMLNLMPISFIGNMSEFYSREKIAVLLNLISISFKGNMSEFYSQDLLNVMSISFMGNMPHFLMIVTDFCDEEVGLVGVRRLIVSQNVFTEFDHLQFVTHVYHVFF